MKTKKTVAKVAYVNRLNNSYYGNPRYALTLITPNGFMYAKTASNAACGYQVSYSMVNSEIECTYHFTNSGNCIIDYIN